MIHGIVMTTMTKWIHCMIVVTVTVLDFFYQKLTKVQKHTNNLLTFTYEL